jgi:hypothetical protein
MFSTPLCSSRQNSPLPKPITGRMSLIVHSGSAISTRFEPAALVPLAFVSSELFTRAGGGNEEFGGGEFH